MIIDLAKQIGAISRRVEQQQSETGEVVTVTLERRYPAEVADVWQAITDPERVRRWFLPLAGDLRPGGSFQLEGHAGGDIMTCEPPRHLLVTFGGESSIVDVLLSGNGEQTLLTLTHSVPIERPVVPPAPCTSDLAGTVPCSVSGCTWQGRSAAILSLPPTVPRCRTSMSGRSRSGSQPSRHRGRPTQTQLRPRSGPRWLSSPPISSDQSELSLETPPLVGNLSTRWRPLDRVLRTGRNFGYEVAASRSRTPHWSKIRDWDVWSCHD